ncbi:hypothetical protein, partial [Streptomyces sp. NPDC007206]|uniref:hypothetical protein n=1 Tax=Streptomyces sp. NPDC007206 TaxID=3154317 RepID=UPI003406D10D
PTTGRFISLDPLFEATSPQELNGYSYAGDDPINQADPTGLCPADLCGVGYPIGGTGTSPSNPTRYVNTGPVDPGDSSAGYCHYGSCGRTHYNSGGTAHTSSGSTATTSCNAPANRMCRDAPALYNAVSAAAARETLSQTLHDYLTVGAVIVIGVPVVYGCTVGSPVIGPACVSAVSGAGMSVNEMYSGAPEGVEPVAEADPAGPSWFPYGSDKIPSDWAGPAMTKKFRKQGWDKAGFVWRAPKGQDSVRIDMGNPLSKWESQRVDHVVINSGGRIIGRDGKPISQDGILSDPEAAHIPLSEWQTWRTWNAP